MRLRKGKTQRIILEYLDKKAETTNVSEKRTALGYADLKELQEVLGLTQDAAMSSVYGLIKTNRVRVYPGLKRGRAYGSTKLPEVTTEERREMIEGYACSVAPMIVD